MGTILKACKVCNKQYSTKNGAYCSRDCYNIGRLKPRIEGDCERCGKHFVTKYTTTNWLYNNKIARRFCSVDCRRRGQSKEKIPQPCKNCGKVRMLYPSDVKLGRGKFCSKPCAAQVLKGENSPHWKEGVKRACEECGKDFNIEQWRLNEGRKALFCSQACHYKNIESTSSVKVRWDWEWLHIRSAFLEDRPLCAKCGSGDRLEVDHIVPRAIAPERFKDPENLQVLCHTCHMAKTKQDIPRIIEAKRLAKS